MFLCSCVTECDLLVLTRARPGSSPRPGLPRPGPPAPGRARAASGAPPIPAPGPPRPGHPRPGHPAPGPPRARATPARATPRPGHPARASPAPPDAHPSLEFGHPSGPTRPTRVTQDLPGAFSVNTTENAPRKRGIRVGAGGEVRIVAPQVPADAPVACRPCQGAPAGPLSASRSAARSSRTARSGSGSRA